MAHFHELKQEMNSSREAERNNLTTLTLQSDTAMKELQKKKEKVNVLTEALKDENYSLIVHHNIGFIGILMNCVCRNYYLIPSGVPSMLMTSV